MNKLEENETEIDNKRLCELHREFAEGTGENPIIEIRMGLDQCGMFVEIFRTNNHYTRLRIKKGD